MADAKIPFSKDAEALSKLTKEPVEVKVGTYALNEDGDKVIKTGEVPAFLHRLTQLERNHLRACSTIVYRDWIKNGGEESQARDAVSGMIPRMTVYFALKIDSKAGSDRFFTSQDLILEYPFEEGIYELYERYLKEFQLTESEWGNFVRARSLGTFSALPAISQEQISLDKPSEN